VTLCTIAIPVFNRAATIGSALDSALAQSLPKLEIIVVDNGSTDGTWDVLQGYADDRLRCLRNKQNIGLTGNFNRCLHLARGKYVRILCSDDRIIEDCLLSEVAMMEAHTAVGVLTTKGRMVDESRQFLRFFADTLNPGIHLGTKAICLILQHIAHTGFNPLNYPSGVLLRRTVANETGGFDLSFHAAGDIDLYIRMLEHSDLVVMDQFGAEVTVHPGQSGSLLKSQGVDTLERGRIFKRYELVLRQYETRPRTLAQYAALCILDGCYYQLHGENDLAEASFLVARSMKVGFLKKVVTISRLFITRGLRRLVRSKKS